jgi:hypothetical protein
MNVASLPHRLLFAAAVLVGAGCDGSGPASPGGGANAHGALIDACSLLTQAEAEAVMGKPVLKVEQDTSHYITHCSYQGDTTAGYYLPTHLDFTVFTTAGVQGYQHSTVTTATYFSTIRSTFAPNEQEVAGVGDGAVWLTKVGKLYFYKGDVAVDVIYSPNGTPIIDTTAASRAGETTAALDIAARL